MCLTQQSVCNGHHLYRSILEGSLTLTLRKSLTRRVCHRYWKVKSAPREIIFYAAIDMPGQHTELGSGFVEFFRRFVDFSTSVLL